MKEKISDNIKEKTINPKLFVIIRRDCNGIVYASNKTFASPFYVLIYCRKNKISMSDENFIGVVKQQSVKDKKKPTKSWLLQKFQII